VGLKKEGAKGCEIVSSSTGAAGDYILVIEDSGGALQFYSPFACAHFLY
jgi:hypothetical protein